eukprot:SAG31_NODE_690_length_12796_cov_4.634559_9_plen_50_part_00
MLELIRSNSRARAVRADRGRRLARHPEVPKFRYAVVRQYLAYAVGTSSY